MVSREDAFTVNNIIELNNLNAVQRSSFVQEDTSQGVAQSPEEEYETVPPVDYVAPDDRRQMLNDAFIAGVEAKERAKATAEVTEEAINPTTPEIRQSDHPSEVISGGISKEISISEVYTGEKAEEHSEGGRTSIRAKIEAFREEQKPPMPLTREEKDRQGMEYLSEIMGERTMGR